MNRQLWPPLKEMADSIRQQTRPADGFTTVSRQRIAAVDADIGAFLSLAENDPEPAISGPLAGIPVAVKDNIAVAGMGQTCGSRILEPHRAVYDATVIARLKENGGRIIGKANMDEFAMGSTTEHSAFQPTRNPWNPGCVPGGSSGGSAAAVAAGMVPVALGSDTGGSVRQPAALCGIVGFKPSYGALSRHGLVLYGSSLDQIGILARSTADTFALFSAIAGPDPQDETTGGFPALSDSPLPVDIPPGRVGVIRAFAESPALSPAIREAMARAQEAVRNLGGTLVELDLPGLADWVVPAYYLTACAEASSNLSRFDGVRFGTRVAEPLDELETMINKTRGSFGAETRLRILLGTFVLRSGHYDQYYCRAQQARRLIARQLQEAWRQCDSLLLPTFPTTAPRFGELLDNPLTMKLADIFTVTANLTGLPAISLPVHMADGLPTAVQLMGPRFADLDLLARAQRLESVFAFDPSASPVARDLAARFPVAEVGA